ncbi:metallophosphoesterase [Cytobacillus suaedae]|nr:metallophosphoesterase [Cytobacillus suaedae]
MGMVFIGIVSVLLYGALVYYVGWSSWSLFRPKESPYKRKIKILYIITLTIVSTSFIVGRVFGFVLFNILGAYWMAVFYLLLIILPVVHLSVWLLQLTRVPRHRVEKWAGVVTFILVIGLISYGSYNAYSPVVSSYQMNIDKPAGDIGELNVVMASDMHFGLLSNRDHAERLVKEINLLQPDIVLFPGDVFDDDIDQYIQQEIDEVMDGIKSTYGVYASLGNHDKYEGTMEELITVLEDSDIEVLYDEAMLIENSLTIVGRKDLTENDRLSVPALMDGVDMTKPIIMLDHQPYELDIAQQNGIDLLVAGHTHRGQVFPGNLITSKVYEVDWGYLQKEQLHTVVSSGYGFWGPPIRLGSRSEIVQITVTFAQQG